MFKIIKKGLQYNSHIAKTVSYLKPLSVIKFYLSVYMEHNDLCKYLLDFLRYILIPCASGSEK